MIVFHKNRRLKKRSEAALRLKGLKLYTHNADHGNCQCQMQIKEVLMGQKKDGNHILTVSKQD